MTGKYRNYSVVSVFSIFLEADDIFTFRNATDGNVYSWNAVTGEKKLLMSNETLVIHPKDCFRERSIMMSLFRAGVAWE